MTRSYDVDLDSVTKISVRVGCQTIWKDIDQESAAIYWGLDQEEVNSISALLNVKPSIIQEPLSDFREMPHCPDEPIREWFLHLVDNLPSGFCVHEDCVEVPFSDYQEYDDGILGKCQFAEIVKDYGDCPALFRDGSSLVIYGRVDIAYNEYDGELEPIDSWDGYREIEEILEGAQNFHFTEGDLYWQLEEQKRLVNYNDDIQYDSNWSKLFLLLMIDVEVSPPPSMYMLAHFLEEAGIVKHPWDNLDYDQVWGGAELYNDVVDWIKDYISDWWDSPAKPTYQEVFTSAWIKSDYPKEYLS